MYNIYRVTHCNIRDRLNQIFTKAIAGFVPAGTLLGYSVGANVLSSYVLRLYKCLQFISVYIAKKCSVTYPVIAPNEHFIKALQA